MKMQLILTQKICVIDHLTSSTAVVLPIKRFIDIAHRKGTMILVDGAHAIGHVPIDIKNLDPDFYTSNFHKWLYAPRGCAFLYINKKYQDQIVPLSISHGQNYSLNSRFSFTGTRDYTPFLCLKSCFKFFDAIGGEEAHAYQRTLVREAYQLLITKWGTGGILTQYQDEYIGKFALIKLPNSNVDFPGNSVSEKAIHIQNLLYEKYKIENPFNVLNDELYIRISAQVYNELSDYEYLANSMLELFKIV